eukprot:s1588_g8.t1
MRSARTNWVCTELGPGGTEQWSCSFCHKVSFVDLEQGQESHRLWLRRTRKSWRGAGFRCIWRYPRLVRWAQDLRRPLPLQIRSSPAMPRRPLQTRWQDALHREVHQVIDTKGRPWAEPTRIILPGAGESQSPMVGEGSAGSRFALSCTNHPKATANRAKISHLIHGGYPLSSRPPQGRAQEDALEQCKGGLRRKEPEVIQD